METSCQLRRNGWTNTFLVSKVGKVIGDHAWILDLPILCCIGAFDDVKCTGQFQEDIDEVKVVKKSTKPDVSTYSGFYRKFSSNLISIARSATPSTPSSSSTTLQKTPQPVHMPTHRSPSSSSATTNGTNAYPSSIPTSIISVTTRDCRWKAGRSGGKMRSCNCLRASRGLGVGRGWFSGRESIFHEGGRTGIRQEK